MSPITTKIITSDEDVFTITTTPTTGETWEHLVNRHAQDVLYLMQFIESQMGKSIDRLVNEGEGYDDKRESGEDLEDFLGDYQTFLLSVQ